MILPVNEYNIIFNNYYCVMCNKKLIGFIRFFIDSAMRVSKYKNNIIMELF